MSDLEQLRLNKQLALQLGISRREADTLIAEGKVSVNGRPTTLGARFKINDIIKVGDKLLPSNTAYQYILFNKPVGYVCSRRDQGETPTIYAIIPKEYHHLKPVGRLDKDSSGLLVLSNDGDFTFRMTHPKFTKVKIYNIVLDRNLEPLHQQMISDHGIQLEDGSSKLQLERTSEEDRKHWQVTMHEGRNRQIRRTFLSLGYTVNQLHRIQFGNYSLGDMKSGEIKIADMR